MSLRLILGAAILLAALTQPSHAVAASQDLATIYEHSLQQFDAGELETAANGLKEVLKADSRFLPAHVLLARVYLEQGDGAQAEKELRIALRLGADRSLVILPLADAYAHQRKYRQTLDTIQTGNFNPSLNAKILGRRGDAFLHLGKKDEALIAYREAAYLSPKATAPLLGQAGVHMATGDFDQAEVLVTAALDRNFQDPEAWQVKGLIKHARGQLREALQHYSHALSLDEDSHSLRVARAGVSMDLGKDREALSDLEYLAEKDLFDPQVYYLLGVVQARLGLAEDSQKSMQQANEMLLALPEKVVREHGETLLLSSLVAYSLGEWEKARDYLKDYVSRHPGSPGGRKLLGSLLFGNADYDKAIRVLEPALEQIPDDHKLLTLLGKAYLKKGWSVVAVETLQRAVAAGATDPDTKTQLARALLASGKEEEGLAQLREVFEQNPIAREAGTTLVLEYLKRTRYRAAAEIALVLSERYQDDMELLNLLAGTEVAAGDLVAARAHYQRILQEDPGHLVVGVNLAKIDRAEGRFEQARERLERLAKLHSASDLVLTEMARLELDQGNRDAAIERMQKAVALNERSLTHQLLLGELYLQAETYEALYQLGQKLDRLFPGEGRVRSLIGRAYLAEGRLGKARNEFRSMSKRAGSNARIFLEAGRLSHAAGDNEWAAWSLSNALKIKPDWLEPRVMLIEVYLLVGKKEKAADLLGHLVRHQPDLPVTQRLAGDLALVSGDTGQAIEAYQTGLRMGGGENIAMRLFQAHIASNDLEKAVGFLEAEISGKETDRMSPLLGKALAEGYLRLDNRTRARAIYEQLVADGLQDASVFNNLAMIHAEDDVPKALQLARRAHEIAPDSAAISDTLGWLLVQEGQAAEGLLHLRNAHLRAASDRDIRYHIASALVALDRHDEARQELKDILSDDHPFDGRDAALALREQIGIPN